MTAGQTGPGSSGYSSLSQGAAELMAARAEPRRLGVWVATCQREACSGTWDSPQEPWGQKTGLFPPRRQQREGLDRQRSRGNGK